jgi:hypothetical protein
MRGWANSPDPGEIFMNTNGAAISGTLDGVQVYDNTYRRDHRTKVAGAHPSRDSCPGDRETAGRPARTSALMLSPLDVWRTMMPAQSRPDAR